MRHSLLLLTAVPVCDECAKKFERVHVFFETAEEAGLYLTLLAQLLGNGQFRLWIICFVIGCSVSDYGGESAALGEVAGSVAGPLAINPRAIKIITKGG